MITMQIIRIISSGKNTSMPYPSRGVHTNKPRPRIPATILNTVRMYDVFIVSAGQVLRERVGHMPAVDNPDALRYRQLLT